jgi:hypothetical protein
MIFRSPSTAYTIEHRRLRIARVGPIGAYSTAALSKLIGDWTDTVPLACHVNCILEVRFE